MKILKRGGCIVVALFASTCGAKALPVYPDLGGGIAGVAITNSSEPSNPLANPAFGGFINNPAASNNSNLQISSGNFIAQAYGATASVNTNGRVSLKANGGSGSVPNAQTSDASLGYSFTVTALDKAQIANEIVPVDLQATLTTSTFGGAYVYANIEALVGTKTPISFIYAGENSVESCPSYYYSSPQYCQPYQKGKPFIVQPFRLQVGEVVKLALGVGVHTNATQSSGSASIDPYIFVDPSFPDAADFSIQVSDGVSNVPISAATPIPGALPLFTSGLGIMGLLGWRRKRKGAAEAAA